MESSQKRAFQLRFTILGMMIVIALVAGWCAVERERRQRRAAVLAAAEYKQLQAEIARATDRVNWSSAMLKRGYVTEAQLALDQGALAVLQQRLRGLTVR